MPLGENRARFGRKKKSCVSNWIRAVLKLSTMDKFAWQIVLNDLNNLHDK